MSLSHVASNEIQKRLPNPFLSSVSGSPLDQNLSDVSEINSAVFEKCRALISDVREQKITQALCLFGEPGSGKTHLLSRLRESLEKDSGAGQEALFIPIRMVTSASMLWRYLRRHLAAALLRHRSFSRVLKQSRDQIAEHDRNLAIVVANLNQGVHYADSAAWLRGEDLPEEALKILGVSAFGDEEEQDASSRRIVLTVCNLSEPIPFVFCFDQLEALQSYAGDSAGFFKLGQVISDLYDNTKNAALISCLQTSLLPMLETAVRGADRDRMMGRRAGLSALNFEEALKLVAARLRTIPELQGQHPIKKSDIKDLFEQDGLCVARKVIVRCQEVFDKWSQQPPQPVKTLAEELEEKLMALQRTPRLEDAEGILRNGLPAMLHLRGIKVAGSERPNTSLDGVVEGKKKTALAVCNQRAGLVLIRRLERVQKDWQSSGAERLLILRDARNGIGVGALKTREAVDKIEKAGGRIVSVKPEALAVLEAISRLLGNARSGDLTYQGDSVPATTVEDWLRNMMPREIDELLEEIGGDREVARDDLAGMLMDLLAKAKVIAVEDAASQLGKTAEEVEECGRRNASLVGFAGGNKRVLFRIVERQQAGALRE